jgi:hypothetical protein
MRIIASREQAARLDERQRMSDEIDDVLTRHSKNRDLSPIAELREYLRDVKRVAPERQDSEGGL